MYFLVEANSAFRYVLITDLFGLPFLCSLFKAAASYPGSLVINSVQSSGRARRAGIFGEVAVKREPGRF
jgi:hypothetical protein